MSAKKKLLLLGGSQFLRPVIEAAKKLGIYTITCDYLPDNAAHKLSDEYHNISIVDREAVLEVARMLDVDGVMSFACDVGVVTAAYVADKLGLPSCGPYESVCILQSKGRFRQFLTDNGFAVPTAGEYSSVEEVKADMGRFRGSVIVKPVDSAGSKGVSRVDNEEQIEEAVRHALAYSFCGKIVVEDFIEKKGDSSDSEFFSVNGEVKFASFSRQLFDVEASGPYTPAAYSWPASISAENQRELTSEIQRLLKLLGMGTSIYNVETREGTDGKAYIMEVTPRGGGNRLAEMLRYATGTDLITNAVRAAVGMPVESVEQSEFDGHWAEVILHGDAAGTFDQLWIAEEIRGCVEEEDLWIQPGDQVEEFSAANKTIGTLVLRFDSGEQMQKVMSDLKSYVKVVLKREEQ